MPNSSTLNPEQLEAVTHQQGPLLIIAGAGTGKTTVITKRVEHLILEKKVSPSHILALTFTEKAAAEMVTRIDEILPYGYTNLWIETFHAFCDRLLRQESIHIGLNPGFDLLTEAESLLFLRKHLFKFELQYFRPLGNPMKFLQGMLTHFARLKDDDITPEQYLTFSKTLSKRSDIEEVEKQKTMELAKAFETYEKLKTKEGVMDFSDLISNTLKLLRARPNILKQYQEQFEYILVDEFQDTNYAQNEMAILLAGKKQNITVVGDDDQSIYRWRGAALANMLQFRSHFPNAKIISLTKNYRSTQIILDSSYKLIQNNNPDRLEIKENIDKKLIAVRGIQGDGIEFLHGTRAEDEAELVTQKIKEDIIKNKRKFNDYAILVRANDHALPFQRALERLKIPYQFLGPGHLFQQDEIKDLICYLRVLSDIEDSSSLYRILTLPLFSIQARDIATLLTHSKKNNLTLFESMEQVDETSLTTEGKESVKRILEMIKKHLEQIPQENAGQILYHFMEDSGLMGHYLDPSSLKTERQAQNIAKLFDKLQSYATNHDDASVFAIVDWIDLSMELGESPLAAEVDWTENNAVNILTVHSSKGLEFPVVFMVNLVTQRFPSRDRKEQIPVPLELIKEELPQGDENLEEERRLFYVAMTRAKDKLFFSSAKFYGEGKRERKVSPFVLEALSKEYIESILQKETKEEVQQLSLLEVFNANFKNEKEMEKEKKAESRVPIEFISYSQIQTFNTCPLHYKLKYILNVPSPASAALSYGISVHSTLRDFFLQMKSEQKIQPEMIHNLLKTNWINQGYTSKLHEEQSYTQANEMLFSYAKKTLEEKPDTIAIELPFQFSLNKLKVGGRIDRIDRLPDGKIEIIDYKTGPTVPDEKKVKNDFQLTLYALAASEIRDDILQKNPEDIVLSLYYIGEGKKLSTVRTKEDLEEAKKQILEKVDEISTSDFHCTGGMFCKNCEYKMLCMTSFSI